MIFTINLQPRDSGKHANPMWSNPKPYSHRPYCAVSPKSQFDFLFAFAFHFDNHRRPPPLTNLRDGERTLRNRGWAEQRPGTLMPVFLSCPGSRVSDCFLSVCRFYSRRVESGEVASNTSWKMPQACVADNIIGWTE